MRNNVTFAAILTTPLGNCPHGQPTLTENQSIVHEDNSPTVVKRRHFRFIAATDSGNTSELQRIRFSNETISPVGTHSITLSKT
jgi:hypothetical protein